MSVIRLASAGKEPPDPPVAACLVVMQGLRVGRRFDLAHGTTTIGRSEDNDICLPFDWISRKHAEIVWDHRGLAIRDAGSTSGIYLNDRATTEGVLVNGDRICLGQTVFRIVIGDEIESAEHAELYRQSMLDALTQVFNRTYFDEWLRREVAIARRHDAPLSLLVIDVDGFRRVNEVYGEDAGHGALRELASSLRGGVVARLGGDRFAVALTNASLEAAVTHAERLRIEVGQLDDQRIPITISAGVATLAPDESAGALMDRALARLAQAKAEGEGRVVG